MSKCFFDEIRKAACPTLFFQKQQLDVVDTSVLFLDDVFDANINNHLITRNSDKEKNNRNTSRQNLYRVRSRSD